MTSTQETIPVSDISNNTVTLKSGDIAVVLQTSAVNFGLLSENEQIAIIGAFAGLLNSLSFSIQILIRSKRLDISNYLKKLDAAQHLQTNQLLFQLMGRYRTFIERTIRENEVLDKQFYVIIPLSYYEVGLFKTSPDKMKRVLAALLPRKDHVVRQLAGIGLQTKQLGNEELVKLFYDIYNTPNEEISPHQPVQGMAPQPQPQQGLASHEAVVEAATNPPPPSATLIQPGQAGQFRYPPTLPLPPQSVQGMAPHQPGQYSPVHPSPEQFGSGTQTPSTQALHSRTPFVVEELPDDYGTV
ncbi:hypothetical protein A2631_05255 [Candidatus Daviesbacteria bacterium RIFCSPHIGHO2_01_FULL_44_29]|nr:MAG: hypothetical protein A2631_05255 [Candidatus Daviesbacteria bacterium RIFCSPHIGHO2_01_FULL_44_29]OGE70193.1 MAG: hypothetical protein A3B55_00585 [Candidatus Daviesbacteria bacterium RIFCSPLOWO2_01_FULL_43_15]